MSHVQTSDLLSFDDYSPTMSDGGTARIEVEAVHGNSYNQNQSFNNYGENDNVPPQQNVADESEANQSPTNHNFWSIKYYQKFFDVQSNEVVERIISSVVPTKVSPTYFDQTIKGKPDLYGPIWISVTLIFTIAISGNVANYLQNANTKIHWQYDFHLVSYAATAILCYVWIVPIALWAALKFTVPPSTGDVIQDEASTTPSMISLFCLYGYSLSIYVPVSVLWAIQVSWLQWMLVLMAAFISGAVLIYWLLTALRKSKYFVILIFSILVFHFLLATGFMLYFFHVPNLDKSFNHPTKPLVIANNTAAINK